MSDTHTTQGGAGCAGAVVACVLSYALNHSVGWAIFHFFCSWIYILYALLWRTKAVVPALKAMFL